MSTPLDRYCAFMEALPAGVPQALDQHVTTDVHFRDPFNDTRGIEAYRRILDDMLVHMAGLTIVVTHAGLAPTRHAQAEARGLLRWEMSGRLVALRDLDWRVSGCSEVGFAPDGRVCEHLDHWDAAGQLYEHFPVVGACLRLIRRRIETR